MKIYSITLTLVLLMSGLALSASEPPTPPNLTYQTNGKNLSVIWTAVPNASGYIISYVPYPYNGHDVIQTVDVGDATNFEAELWDGAAYMIAVQAYNNNGNSSHSNIEHFTLDVTPPETPELFYSIEGAVLTISWTSVENVDGYLFSYSPSPYQGEETITTHNMGESTSIQYTLPSGSAFLVSVQAYNEGGVSPYSNIEEVTAEVEVIDNDGDGETEDIDNDGDGFAFPEDCNDNDQSINPHAEEICGDGIDQDCVSGDSNCTTDQDESAPPRETILVSGLVSGTVVFRDSNNTNIAIPPDAFVGIFPSSFWPSPDGPLTTYTDRLRCRISDNGSFGDECYLHEESLTGFATALGNPSEIFQIIVFKNHVNPNVIGWDCDEDEYKHIEETQDEWQTLVVKPENYISAAGAVCSEN